MTRRLARLLAVVAAGAALAACGIPISSGPSRLPAAALPQGLLIQQQATHRVCPQSIGRGLKTVDIYLVQAISGSLVAEPRCIPTTTPITVQSVLELLEAGPAFAEYYDNIESSINIDSDLQSLGPGPTGVASCAHPARPVTFGARCGLATVRLDRYFTNLQGEQPIQEIAQIVYTLAGTPLGVTAVRFLGPNGLAQPVETADGSFVDRPVTTADYKNVGV